MVYKKIESLNIPTYNSLLEIIKDIECRYEQ